MDSKKNFKNGRVCLHWEINITLAVLYGRLVRKSICGFVENLSYIILFAALFENECSV